MSTAVITDPQLETEALSTVERATALVVSNNETRERAADLGRLIAGLAKGVKEWFEPMKRQAAETHRSICAKENESLGPLETAKRYLSSQIGSYDQAQERLRRQEEARQQEEVRQQAIADATRLSQETALNDAIALEAEGDTKGAAAVLANPVPQQVYVPAVVIPRSVPKAEGVSSAVQWKFRITNAALVPDEYKLINEKQIGQIVRAMKDKTNIPGVEAYPEGAARFRA